MSTTLEQHADAAFADRPIGGGTGLRVALAEGDVGRYVARSLGAAGDRLHVRVMVRVDLLSTGRVVCLRLVDGDQRAVADVAIDADAGTVHAFATEAQLVGPMPVGLGWQAIEIALDFAVGRLELWLNGRSVGQAPATPTAPAAVLLGGVVKHTTAAGELHLDELIVSDQPIGPVRVEPAGPHADDPARWLVIYNTAAPDSIAWARAYRAARGIPHANLLGLDLPSSETMDEATFIALRDAVSAHLATLALEAQIAGILCGHGVPGMSIRPGGDIAMIAAQLQRIDGGDSTVANPHATLTTPTRPTADTLAGDRLTARIDGPTLAESIGLHERAIDIETHGLGEPTHATLWLDAVAGGGVYGPSEQRTADWAAGLNRQRLRLPLQQTTPTDPPTDPSFERIDRDGFYLGQHAATPPAGFFGQPAGRRVFAMQMTDLQATAPTLRDADAANWATAALHAGYAATAGSSDVSFIEAAPSAEPLFEALERGWTLGEAWFVATGLLRSPTVLIGDPLLRVPLPKAGWDLFGPFDDAADVRFDEPIAHLRADEQGFDLPLTHQPDAPGPAGYVLRRVDADGQPAGDATVRLILDAGQWRPAPVLASWPEHRGWRPFIEQGIARVFAVWPAPPAAKGVTSIELEAEGIGIVAAVTPDVTERAAALTYTPTESSVRLRVVTVGPGGARQRGPWSAPVALVPANPQPLTVIA